MDDTTRHPKSWGAKKVQFAWGSLHFIDYDNASFFLLMNGHLKSISDEFWSLSKKKKEKKESLSGH